MHQSNNVLYNTNKLNSQFFVENFRISEFCDLKIELRNFKQQNFDDLKIPIPIIMRSLCYLLF